MDAAKSFENTDPVQAAVKHKTHWQQCGQLTQMHAVSSTQQRQLENHWGKSWRSQDFSHAVCEQWVTRIAPKVIAMMHCSTGRGSMFCTCQATWRQAAACCVLCYYISVLLIISEPCISSKDWFLPLPGALQSVHMQPKPAVSVYKEFNDFFLPFASPGCELQWDFPASNPVGRARLPAEAECTQKPVGRAASRYATCWHSTLNVASFVGQYIEWKQLTITLTLLLQACVVFTSKRWISRTTRFHTFLVTTETWNHWNR